MLSINYIFFLGTALASKADSEQLDFEYIMYLLVTNNTFKQLLP